MGESDRYGEYNPERKKFSLGADGNALTMLFIINVTGFLFVLFLQMAFYFAEQDASVFYEKVIRNIAVPGSIMDLARKPWTLFMYNFAEEGAAFMRILSNMIWLWGFGYLFQAEAGNRKLIPLYIYGGVVGAIFFILANNLIPPLRPMVSQASMLGANASVMAVAMATTTLIPYYRIFKQIRGGIPLWVVMFIYALIDFVGVIDAGAAHSLAHFGGLLAGYFFVVLLRKDIDVSAWMVKVYDNFSTAFTPKKKVKEEVFYSTGNRKPFNKKAIISQQRVDDILDKINTKGVDALSKEEKAILKKAADDDLI